ncbi:MAG: type II secretion system F family protein [Candidatus Lambdaproteobacteria bacterium]|nr:type II secretion system F family protein [Candidatus Lambdaproteobacteria bacterium]
MALYTYRALRPDGRTESGTLDAVSAGEAKAVLRSRSAYPVEVRPAQALQLGIANPFRRRAPPKLSARQLATFTRQFATLLQATIPYDAALGMMLLQAGRAGLREVLAGVRGRVVEGATLADALAAFPGVFPQMVVSMVRSGEAGGSLVLIMRRLAEHYEGVARLHTRLRSALVYPAFMMVFGTSVVVFMVTYIIPKIARLFESFGAQLPLPTRILIAASELLTGYWWAILPLLALALWGALHYLGTEGGQWFRDRLELAAPYWKEVRRRIIVQRFTQSLATLLKSGVELKGALEIATGVMGNRLYMRAMDRVILDVQNRGISLSVALGRVGLIPDDVLQMIAIGEETATLDEMLENVAARLSIETTATLDAATSLFEPVMILMMGAAVGFIVLSILLPMLQLNQLVG